MAGCECHIIDSEGDMVITFDGVPGSLSYKVSSHAMRLASRGWIENAKPRESWSGAKRFRVLEGVFQWLDLGTDDPDATHILLLIAHLQFKKVPDAPSSATLAKVAQLCTKYDLKDMVCNFMDRWVEVAKATKFMSDMANETNRMWLAHFFDQSEMYGAVIMDIMTYMSPEVLSTSVELPNGIKEHMLRNMNRRLEDICKSTYALYSAVKNNRATCSIQEASAADQRQCEFQCQGAALCFMLECGWPISHGAARLDRLENISLYMLALYAEKLRERATRSLAGTAHVACTESISVFVEKLPRMYRCDRWADIDAEMKNHLSLQIGLVV